MRALNISKNIVDLCRADSTVSEAFGMITRLAGRKTAINIQAS
jgi:hypothetical protein